MSIGTIGTLGKRHKLCNSTLLEKSLSNLKRELHTPPVRKLSSKYHFMLRERPDFKLQWLKREIHEISKLKSVWAIGIQNVSRTATDTIHEEKHLMLRCNLFEDRLISSEQIRDIIDHVFLVFFF